METTTNNFESAAMQHSNGGNSQVLLGNAPSATPPVSALGVGIAAIMLSMIGLQATTLSDQLTVDGNHQKQINQGLLTFAQTVQEEPNSDINAYNPLAFNNKTSLVEVGLTANATEMSVEDQIAREAANSERAAFTLGMAGVNNYRQIARTKV